jgi:hypothetical protein
MATLDLISADRGCTRASDTGRRCAPRALRRAAGSLGDEVRFLNRCCEQSAHVF